MMHITILCVGKLKEEYAKKATSDYLSRLSRFAKADVIEVPEGTVTSEGEALLKKIPEKCFLIALDLRGRMMDSEAFAGLLDRQLTSGVSHFVFAIGGSDGISEAVTDRADLRLCLSPMTFTHQMTRVILAEQIYRAMKINAGETYHK